VKNFAQPSFFLLFDILVSATNPGLKLSDWKHDGVDFQRERHSFTGPRHGLAVEIFTLTRSGGRGWSLMVIKEFWWAGKENKALKTLRWARPIAGKRQDILAWLHAQDAKIGRSPPVGQKNTGANDDDVLAASEDGGTP
jgi:hypothetical protein